MDAYRSELDAAERRLALLNEAIAERELQLRPGGAPAVGARRWAFVGASLAFFTAVTAVAAVSFARSPVPKLEVSSLSEGLIPVPQPPPDRYAPLLVKLQQKIEAGTATEEEREALHELQNLHLVNGHLRRSFEAMARLADDQLSPTDLAELDRHCYLGGHRRCLALVRRARER